ncbi:MAG: GNAT family N-acetyltransferase, partial [Vicinamibacterales bacterium]
MADVDRAIDTVVLAFAADPVTRWSWPEAHQYLGAMASLARAFGGPGFPKGGGHCTDDFGGAALWLPPDVHVDDGALVAVIERTVPVARHAEIFSVFEQMAAYHPSEPHWYLPLIGVDPAHQGKGYG